jgi:protocatechuate 3,4-dioxygenase beta subunit
MDHDDRPRGAVLARREALRLLAGAGLATLWPQAARSEPGPNCIVRPEQTLGPYFVDTGLARSDIRSDTGSGRVEAGIPLELEFRVARLQARACSPLPQARVELWQCNAHGSYSGVRDPHADTRGRDSLRGYQVTDGEGRARFVTVYPGWYPGRAVHLHFAVHDGAGPRRGVFTSQLYFDDVLSDQVFRAAPYSARGGRRVRNEADFIYRRGGRELILPVRHAGNRLTATFDIAMQTDRLRG